MNNITSRYSKSFLPTQGLLVYRQQNDQHRGYVQAFDVDPQTGHPINFHLLSEQEQRQLAKLLTVEKEKKKSFLRLNGLLPDSVLYLDAEQGQVIWYTPPQRRQIYFVESLTIPSGMANLPALLWIGRKNSLRIFALLDTEKPTLTTALYFAPFFNTGAKGDICMGTVGVQICQSTSLDEYIIAWENAFFNSYFSHLFDQHQPVKGNIIQLWQELINTDTEFPLDRLTLSPFTLQTILA